MHFPFVLRAVPTAVLVATVLLHGCFSSNTPDEEVMDYDAFLRARAERQCVTMQRCTSVPTFTKFWRDFETCTQSFYEQRWLPEATLVAEGRVRFDLEAAEACLDAMDASPCSGANAPACGRVLSPGVEAGEPCVFGSECASRTCSPSADGCARCSPVLAPGAECDLGDPALGVCPAGYACLIDDAGPTRHCVVSTPRPFVDVGEDGFCDYLGLEGTYEVCAPSLYCGDDYRCHRRRSLGSECDPWLEQCAEDLTCSIASDGTNRCLATRVMTLEGDACDVTLDDTVRVCDSVRGLSCHPVDHVCVRYREFGGANGNACLLGVECDSGRCSALSSCEPVSALPAGEPCLVDSMCASSFCDVGVCRSLEACVGE